jgi:hypothetical protein
VACPYGDFCTASGGREFPHFPGSGKSRRGFRRLTDLAVRRSRDPAADGSPDPAIRHRPNLVTDGLTDHAVRLPTDRTIRLPTDTSVLVPTRERGNVRDSSGGLEGALAVPWAQHCLNAIYEW